MKKLLIVMIVLFPLCADAAVCEQSNPHPSANNCMTEGCDGDKQCEKCCEKNCLTCHDSSSEIADLSDPTPWNLSAVEMTQAYPEATATTPVTLADVCSDCHQGNPEEDRFVEGHNHPVEILYTPGSFDTKLVSEPVGPKLVCEQGGTNCTLRCVTCHQLHPGAEGDFQEAGLLRMDNQGSSLCLACHQQ